eukprot:1731004-Rhodomonas_salina.1
MLRWAPRRGLLCAFFLYVCRTATLSHARQQRAGSECQEGDLEAWATYADGRRQLVARDGKRKDSISWESDSVLFVKGHLPLQLWVEKQNEHGPFNQDSSIAVELAQIAADYLGDLEEMKGVLRQDCDEVADPCEEFAFSSLIYRNGSD